MRQMGFLKKSLGVKRWVLLGLIGALFFGFGLSGLLVELGLRLRKGWVIAASIGVGMFTLYLAYRGITGRLSVSDVTKVPESIKKESNRRIIHKRMLMRGPRVVVIGGGTGLSVLLRGLKNYTHNITAVVTVSDDGGGSGVLRTDLGILPPGDIRSCILALADTEPVMEQLLQYRFEKGRLAGQSFGNLFIAAMNGISLNFEEAVKRMSQVLAVMGQVLPVTLEDTVLYAQLKNGVVIRGESNIPIRVLEHDSPIERVFLKPEHPEPLPEVAEAIENADIIVFGPGSLYTSIMPNLLARGLAGYLYRSKAPKVYVCNIMTQPGETDGFSVGDHIRALEDHAGRKILDMVIINDGNIDEAHLKKYAQDGSRPVIVNSKEIRPGIELISDDLISVQGGFIRHDSMGLARIITKLASASQRGLPFAYLKR